MCCRARTHQEVFDKGISISLLLAQRRGHAGLEEKAAARLWSRLGAHWVLLSHQNKAAAGDALEAGTALALQPQELLEASVTVTAKANLLLLDAAPGRFKPLTAQ